MAPHSSTLAWKILWKEEPGGQSMGLQRVRHDWVTSLSLFTFMHWRRKWQPTPVFFLENPRDAGGPGGLPSMGSHRVGHNWGDLAAAAATEPWKSENIDIQKRNTRFKLLVSIDVQLAANFAKNFKSLLSISIVNLSWTCNRYFSDLQQCTNHTLALLWIPLLISQPHTAAWLVLGIRLDSGMRLALLSSPPLPLEKACRL